MKKNHWLLDEYPLLVFPKLACQFGLDESIILQQIHYWLSNDNVGVIMDGHSWIYNSYKEWRTTNFPFWTISKIRRAIQNLEECQVLISKQGTGSWNRKKYYRIDYKMLNKHMDK